jgi:exopolysaccharide biosynthesis predicted pyruvyltransferase EpsI
MFCANDPFVNFLQSRKRARVYLKPYRGNSGDALIWMGDELLLKELGIEQVVDPRKADVILWPGGNPTMWQGNLDGWRECWRLFPDAEFVVAPATFQGKDLGWQTLLQTAKVGIGGAFARDKESYRNLQQLGLSETTIGLGHDPAFQLKDSEWVARHRAAATAEYTLASFRRDHESIIARPSWGRLSRQWPWRSVFFRHQRRRLIQLHQKRLKAIREISRAELPVVECDASSLSFEMFVETVRRAGQVHTDRLHCLILAVLLGKEAFAYPTAYGKLEAVYEHSIKSWAEVNFIKSL